MRPFFETFSIAALAWEICRLHEALTGGPSEARQPWSMVCKDVHDHARATVDMFLDDPTKRPEDWHELNVQALAKEGWKWGFVFDAEAKEDPLLTDWDALPQSVRNTLMMFWHSALAIGMEAGYISEEQAQKMEELHGEDQAAREIEELAQSIVTEGEAE